MKKSDVDAKPPQTVPSDPLTAIPEPVVHPPTHPVLQLQRSLGNQAVQRMLPLITADQESAPAQNAPAAIILDGFAAGSAELPASHPQVLASVIQRLQSWSEGRALVGGAATQDEADPVALSRERAERVRAYLVGAGIAESRIDLEFYGSDWARTPVANPGAAQANRPVQIRIH